jgi:hypothetical protein
MAFGPFLLSGSETGRFLYSTTQGKSATFNRELANIRTPRVFRSSAVFTTLIKFYLNSGESGATPFPDAAPCNQPVIT